MKKNLQTAIRCAKADPRLTEFDIRIKDNELHLCRAGESFARLLPTEKDRQWRMEYFHQEERWEHIEFSGTLEECMAFLAENTHYLFWKG